MKIWMSEPAKLNEDEIALKIYLVLVSLTLDAMPRNERFCKSVGATDRSSRGPRDSAELACKEYYEGLFYNMRKVVRLA